jgi:hypothetical protein
MYVRTSTAWIGLIHEILLIGLFDSYTFTAYVLAIVENRIAAVLNRDYW